jgi:hypothetical protein
LRFQIPGRNSRSATCKLFRLGIFRLEAETIG